MKTFFLPLTMAVLLTGVWSCGNAPQKEEAEASEPSAEEPQQPKLYGGDNSMTALDWAGVYQGTLPCADCEGIKTKITLMKDKTYTKSTVYLGKNDTPFVERGTFSWNESGNGITISPEEGSRQRYQVGENVLFHLDQDGNRITGELADNYLLKKNHVDSRIENKKWILVELMGQEIKPAEGRKQAFLMLNSETGRAAGDDGCNRFNGSYELKEGNRISFGMMAGTLMACPDMTLPDQFGVVLGKADNYSVQENRLSLNKARMAPLARFVLVEE